MVRTFAVLSGNDAAGKSAGNLQEFSLTQEVYRLL